MKQYNKINKCVDLKLEIEKMWYLKTTTVLVIGGALGIIKKRTDKHINKIPSKSQSILNTRNCTLQYSSASSEVTINVSGKILPPPKVAKT